MDNSFKNFHFVFWTPPIFRCTNIPALSGIGLHWYLVYHIKLEWDTFWERALTYFAFYRHYYSWGMEPYITFSVESFQGQVRLQMKLGYSRPAFSYWVTAHGVKIDNSPSHVTSHTIVSTRLLSSSANTYTLVIYVSYRFYVCYHHFTYFSHHHSSGSSSQQCDN